MLEELSVRNYALVESLSLSFEGGLNILTGETGAGKSIIVGSLSFLLGAKADPDVIRTGAEEASVSAVISLRKENREISEWLAARDIQSEDGQIVVRRSIKTSGRGALYIQNIPVTRNDLAEFMAQLFDLHGQHTHESLLRKETHRKYLDRFAGLESEVADFNRIFLELAEKKKALEASLNSERNRDLRIEMLRYAVEEIDKAALKIGESRELEAEASRLGDFEKLAALVNTSAAAFFDDEPSMLALARRARNSLEGAVAIDPSLAVLGRRMDDLYYEAEDLVEEFRAYQDNLKSDPARLEAVEERLALLYRLKKKYGPGGTGEDAVLAYREEAASELEALAGAAENRENLQTDIAALEKKITLCAASISAKRLTGAKEMGKRISGIIANLGMPHAEFSIMVNPKGHGQNPGQALICGPWGADEVEFLISANAGEPLKELARIASGGELSRVMLAIKTVLVDADAEGGSVSNDDVSPETLIFDEIDTGIGGEVALAVGEYLSKIGKFKQIFCVTHLAGIAVRADNHFKVEKQIQGVRTVTGVSALSSRSRREEIARMLSGDSSQDAALAHADALLARYRAGR
ncbi:MAG: DNA repair protein RecN [Treponema sp.]|jgi:DNA repair protein RecN (Recombination protein N)|nr:DNA repair protein RecN [Treponema sp.]